MSQEIMRNGQLDRSAAVDALRKFLEDLVRASGLQLHVSVQPVAATSAGVEGGAEILVDLDGADKDLVLERNAEVLRAIEHLAYKALRLEPAFHERIHIDCGGYRALRFEELRMTARVAAERVEASRQPFKLNPMSSRERRIVHLALRDMPAVRTESTGMGEERQVIIHPAESKPPR